jgi:membrane protease YdiL (CAAX protease family)
MTAFDHVLAFALAVGFPAHAAWTVPRLAQRIAADPVNARTNEYIWTMALEWGVTVAAIALWWWTARPIGDLGLRLPEGPAAWWWTLALGGAGIAFFAQQGYTLATSPEAQAQVQKQLESQPGVRTILPATAREVRVFSGLAITAGICEEVLYRGYMLWYLHSLWPGRLAIAVAVAIVIFGLGHAYQGVRGIVQTAIVGSIAMGLYLLTGSLLAPILLHATIDLVNGLSAYRAFRRPATLADGGAPAGPSP